MLFPTFRSLSSMKSIFSPLSTLHLPPHHVLSLSPPFAQFHPQIVTYPCHRFHFNPLPSLRWNPSAISCTSSYAAMPSKGLDRAVPDSRTLYGEIHVIIGPMFAGKTTDLLRRIQVAIDSGRKVAMIKSDKDNRYGLDSVVSHDGAKMPCFALSQLSLLRSKMGNRDYDMLDVIGIDEAQFFEDLYDFCRIAADCDGKTVIVAGLDGDYLRRRFGAVLDVIPLADSVTKLTSRCEVCGRPAFFTLRKTDEKKIELIGGADAYMPVCRWHYVNGQVVVETSRFLLESRKIDCEPCSEVVSLSSF